MKKACTLNALNCCVLVLITTISNATVTPFESRLGGLAYYDPILDITWAADANLTGIDTWENQMAWVASLTIGGVSGWRLPSADVNGDNIVVDCNGDGVTVCKDNELSYLFWEEGIYDFQTGVFSNIQDTYWTSTELSDGFGAWYFRYYNGIIVGETLPNLKDGGIFAWPVRSGDISSIPIPATVWLFASGLLYLFRISCRK